MEENTGNIEKDSLQELEKKGDTGINKENQGRQGIFDKPKRVNNIKAARRLMAKIIYEFQKGSVPDSKAKTLAYLLIKYSELYKTESLEVIEKRLSELEEVAF